MKELLILKSHFHYLLRNRNQITQNHRMEKYKRNKRIDYVLQNFTVTKMSEKQTIESNINFLRNVTLPNK